VGVCNYSMGGAVGGWYPYTGVLVTVTLDCFAHDGWFRALPLIINHPLYHPDTWMGAHKYKSLYVGCVQCDTVYPW